MKVLLFEHRNAEKLPSSWRNELEHSRKEFGSSDDTVDDEVFDKVWVIPAKMSSSQLLQYVNLIKEVERDWIRKEDEKKKEKAKEVSFIHLNLNCYVCLLVENSQFLNLHLQIIAQV